jgi:hypothetical protein
VKETGIKHYVRFLNTLSYKTNALEKHSLVTSRIYEISSGVKICVHKLKVGLLVSHTLTPLGADVHRAELDGGNMMLARGESRQYRPKEVGGGGWR